MLPKKQSIKEIHLFHLFVLLYIYLTNFHFVDSQQFAMQMSGQKSWPSITTAEPNHRVWQTFQISKKIFLLLPLRIECLEKLKSSKFLPRHILLKIFHLTMPYTVWHCVRYAREWMHSFIDCILYGMEVFGLMHKTGSIDQNLIYLHRNPELLS